MVQPKNTIMIIYQYLRLIFHFDRYGATFDRYGATFDRYGATKKYNNDYLSIS
jgi:hypothetical protein